MSGNRITHGAQHTRVVSRATDQITKEFAYNLDGTIASITETDQISGVVILKTFTYDSGTGRLLSITPSKVE